MSSELRKMVAQMIVAGFRGTKPDENSPVVRDIREYQPGGIILFDYDIESRQYGRNIESPEQLKNLTRFLSGLSGNPLLIAVDQEGGKVNRLKERYGFPATESASEIGTLDSEETTVRWSSKIADTLAESGINYNCAPSVDVNLNPQNPVIGSIGRSFSADPADVVKHAKIFINTLNSRNVLTSVKHFPGHGSSRGDTHEGLVDVTDCWKDDELIPFRKIISAGMADMVMTSHIFNRRLDEKYPATLSSNVITGLLRDELGFRGVVVSDDMQMGAIRDHYGFEESVKLAVNAGVDIITFGNNLTYEENIIPEFIKAVEKMVLKGEISEERIIESWKRIVILKNKLLV